MERNKTQLELSKYIGVSNTTVNNYVKGYNMPRMDKIDKICSFFNIKRSDLLENKQITEPPATLQSIEDIDFTGIDRIAAHYKGEEFSEESLNAIQDFVEYVRMKNNRNKK
ncbi:helix-turn-helix domain-containing protein [Parvimonas micra]